jgi:LmbE family N-acetylglucosaminyl deacetylase
VQQAVCLNYGDGKLKDMPQVKLVAHIVQIIREFKPDIVFTFDETGAYGHPDHIAISLATTEACWQAGTTTAFTEQIEQGLVPHRPTRLYHSLFPQSDRLLLQMIVRWLQSLDNRYRGSDDFMHGLMLFADESSMLGYASDHIQVQWYPSGFYIIEQGEPSTSLYLILAGEVDILREDEEGNLVHLEVLGPGVFIGETGIAYGKPRNAHVVAIKNTTCLVLSPGEPTNFAGRGEEARFGTGDSASSDPLAGTHITTRIDVADFIEQKINALSQHRSQYPISPKMFPLDMWREMLGQEYFMQVDPPRALETELLNLKS